MKQRVRLFITTDEFINLAFPLIPSLIMLAAFDGYFPSGFPFARWFMFVTAIVFMDVIHNCFSFFILAWLPEAKVLREPHKGYRWSKVWIILGLITIVHLVFFTVNFFTPLDSNLRSGIFSQVGVIKSMFLAYIAFSAHMIKQVQGISLSYNRVLAEQFTLSAEQKKKMNDCEWRERKLFTALLIGFSATMFSGVFWPKAVGRPEMYFTICAMIVVPAVVGLFVNSFLYPFATRSNKWIYLLRTLYFPMHFVHPAVGMIGPAFHGVEFFFVTKKMYQGSELRTSRPEIVLRVFVPIVVMVALFAIFRPDRGARFLLDPLFSRYMYIPFSLLAAVSYAFSFFHFYADRFIFRMRDPDLRRSLGPLLYSLPSDQTRSQSV